MGVTQNKTSKAVIKHYPKIEVVFSTSKINNIINAINKCGGNATDTALALGVGRSTLYAWFKEYPELVEAIADARDYNLDIAESKLMQAVKNGEGWAICFYLKCQGKGRGYVERQELTGKDGKPLNAGPIMADDLTDDELANIAIAKTAINQ